MALTLTRSHSQDTSYRDDAVAARAVDATKVYGKGEAEVRALDGVTVDFATARFTAIMGPSGSGKSTLMHTLAGLDSLTSGSVWIGDVDLGTLKEKKLTQLRRDRIGFIFQAFNLIPTLTAAENIALPMRLAGRKPDAELVRHTSSTPSVCAPAAATVRRSSRVASSSGSRSPVRSPSQPHIIFADEPTGNLDSRTGAEILSFMRQAVRELGQTIVMVTHDPVAASYADRAVFLADGRIVDELDRPDCRQRLRPHAHPGSLITMFHSPSSPSAPTRRASS